MPKAAFAFLTIFCVGCAGPLPTSQTGASLVLAPRINTGGYQTQATVNAYTASNIDHLTLKLFQGSTELASKTIPKAALDSPVTFSNLRNNTLYRIQAYAYLADNTPISDEASSWLDVTTLTDDRPSINPIPVHLVDIPFNGQGTGSLQVTPGGYLPGDPVAMDFLFKGIISTYAGNGTIAFAGDDGPATNASLNNPIGVAVDSAGNLYFSDASNNRIRKVDKTTKIIATVAGNASGTWNGDGHPASETCLNGPRAMRFDAQGNLYFADSSNYRVRKVDKATGTVITVAGNGTGGGGGDNGPATSANLDSVYGIAFDSNENLYVVEGNKSQIRKIDKATGIITTIAGNGSGGFSADEIPATASKLNLPNDLTFDAQGNMYIADASNHRIRKVDKATGIITTVAGNGSATYSGDGGPATAASLNTPRGVTFDPYGNLYIADSGNHRIRKIIKASGTIVTVVGNGTGTCAGDEGQASAASINNPRHLRFDSCGNLFIADKDNQRIRMIR